MSRFLTTLKRSIPCLKYAILPVLTAIYPVFFHYGNNVNFVSFSSVLRLIALFSGIALGIYLLSLIPLKGRGAQAAIVTFVFLLFFHTYGLAFNGLRNWDVIRVEQYSVLPVYVLLGIYATWWVGHISDKLSKQLWTGASIVLTVLIVFNLSRIVPDEIRKASASSQNAIDAQTQTTLSSSQQYPDIYYLVLDEMVGFDAMRQYWGYEDIDRFVGFLQRKGFYIAENSHSETISTFYELAARLNYRPYTYDPSDPRATWNDEFQEIGDNEVFGFLKTLGYTIVVFDESPVGSTLQIPFVADIVHTVPPDTIIRSNSLFFDEFSKLVLNDTMIMPFLISHKTKDPFLEQHQRMIAFTTNELSNIQTTSPKFVFVHLILPHMPFIFNADGSFGDPLQSNNWDKYLGTYIYSLNVAEEMINNIFTSSRSTAIPVIILQSDHGARNTPEGTIVLENYPEEYKTLIVNALYLPGCDDAPLTQDMDSINTFPIVFNCYFDAGIPLIER